MKNNLPKICYWCGIELDNETNKIEHVPPYSFFPRGHGSDLMKVPSCAAHNNQFSALDEDFQIYVKAYGSNQIAIDDFKDRVDRGLRRVERRSFVERLGDNSFHIEINGEKRTVLKIDTESTQMFFGKIIRGIYFYHNEKPAIGMVTSFSLQMPNPDLNSEELFIELSEYFKYMVEGDYNNPDVFRYRYLNLNDGANFFVVLDFYLGIEVIGLITPE